MPRRDGLGPFRTRSWVGVVDVLMLLQPKLDKDKVTRADENEADERGELAD